MAERANAQDPDDERALAEGVRAGDPQTFERLVRTNGGRMLAVARRILKNEEDARDAVQEAFVSAYRARKQFQADARVSTWLHRIVVNAALSTLRKRYRVAEQSIEDDPPEFNEAGHHLEKFVSWTEPADVTVARHETDEMVREAIAKLPDSLRTVLLMRDIEGRDTEQTADALGLTRDAVKMRLHRARLGLRALLAPKIQEAAR